MTVIAVVVAAAAIGGDAVASTWPSSHQRVARALASDRVGDRRGAAEVLLRLPRQMAVELARKALRDPDVEVRLSAAKAAVELGLSGAGDEVVVWLSERDGRLRLAACTLIEVSPTPNAVAALARVLGDADARVRAAAATAMGASGLPDAVSPLLGHVDDSAVDVRIAVVRALGRLGDRRAVVPLESRLQDAEADVRLEAARALGELGDERAVATLMLALQDTAAPVQIQALDALGRLSARDASSAIAALLASGARGGPLRSGPVRDAALKALGRIATPEAVALLVEALAVEGPAPLAAHAPAPVRAALQLAGDRAAAPLIAAMSQSTSRPHASAALLALAELDARGAFAAVIRAAERGTVSLGAALQAIERMGDTRGLPFVLEHLDDADPTVRQHAVHVATSLLDPTGRDGRAVDVVRERVVDPATPVAERRDLIRLLGRTGSSRAGELLLSLAARDDEPLKPQLMAALGELGQSSAAVDALLLAALDDDDPVLRSRAARALARVGRDAAARQLLHRLGVAAEQDRGAIGIALSGSLSRSSDAGLVQLIRAAIVSAPAKTRDALIEGLGRMATVSAGSLLMDLALTPDGDDRRKIAEATAGFASRGEAAQRAGASLALKLLADPDPSVRANAAWALGKVGKRSDAAVLSARLADVDVAVAGNAAAALGRLATRGRTPRSPERLVEPRFVKPLCEALGDYRSYVRVNALASLRVIGARCPDGRERRLLRRAPNWRVRAAVADLLHRGIAVPGAAADGAALAADRRVLRSCVLEERDATVARHCRDGRRAAEATDGGIMVYVVPDGRTDPEPRVAYALALPDGMLRLGIADRRGSLFEQEPPAGQLSLAIPAALAH